MKLVSAWADSNLGLQSRVELLSVYKYLLLLNDLTHKLCSQCSLIIDTTNHSVCIIYGLTSTIID